MSTINQLQPFTTFCGVCNCGCPQLFVDESAPPEQRIILTDDFGSRVRMSAAQFGDLLAQAKSGALDTVI
jgi:diphthamide synthase subunit DPH2